MFEQSKVVPRETSSLLLKSAILTAKDEVLFYVKRKNCYKNWL